MQAMFISLTHLCFIAFLSPYIVLIDVLIYSAAQLQECLINLLTYLLLGMSSFSPRSPTLTSSLFHLTDQKSKFTA